MCERGAYIKQLVGSLVSGRGSWQRAGRRGAARHFLVHQKPVFTTSCSRARTPMFRTINDHRLSPLKPNSPSRSELCHAPVSSANSVDLKQSCPSRTHVLHSPSAPSFSVSPPLLHFSSARVNLCGQLCMKIYFKQIAQGWCFLLPLSQRKSRAQCVKTSSEHIRRVASDSPSTKQLLPTTSPQKQRE